MAFSQRVGRAVLELSIEGGSFVRGAANAQATYRDMARGIAQTNAQINRQAFQFSGRQQIADAAKMAEAVQRVGGASRLVASDQARVNATLRQAIEHYKVLGKEAPKAWLEIEKATRKAEQATKQAQHTQQQSNSFLSSFASRAGIGGSAFSAGVGGAIGGFAGAVTLTVVQRLGQAFTEAASKGSQLINVAHSFDRLTASINQSGAVMLAVTRGATKGLVADLDLMLATNKAILLGLPVTAREMANLARTAVVLGKAMGLDATTALDNLITALGRSSPLILDNLGLVVKVGEANEAYARKLGKSATELTEAEQKLAFYNAAMEAARKKTEELGEPVLTLTEEWNRLSTATGNIVTKWGASANQAGYLSRAIGFLADESARAAENMDLAAQAKERLEKQGRGPNTDSLLKKILLARGPGFTTAEVEREMLQILLESAGMPDAPSGFQPQPGKPSPSTDELIERVDRMRDYSQEMKIAQSEAAKLNAAQRADIDAGDKLGASKEALITKLKAFGVAAGQEERVLRLLTSTTKTAKKETDEWQEAIERSAKVRQGAVELAKGMTTASGMATFKRMTVEAQEAISKALDEGAEAWKRWGGIVPAEISRARTAVALLPEFVDALRKLESTFDPFASVPEGEVATAQANVESDLRRGGGVVEGIKTSEAAARDHNKVLRDLDIARSEAVIRQAEREGAKRAQILVMESLLEQKKRDFELDAAEDAMAADKDALDERLRRGEIETSQYQAELSRRRQQHADHVQQINEQLAIGEAERREMIRRESSFWASELGKRIAGELRGALHEATGRLFSTFFTRVDDETKKQAKAAREDYERIARSGRASAEEITRAFRHMREAEEAAQVKWSDRFKSIWDGIQRHLFNVFDAILEDFINNLLKGMLRALADTALGKRIMGWVDKLIPGGGSVFGTGGEIAMSAGGKLLGLSGGVATTAFSTAAGGTLAASMIAPSVASAAVPVAIASQGVSATVAAGAGTAAGAVGSTGAASAGAGAGGASMGFLANPAFWTNPYTIAAAVGAALGVAVWKKGLFRGGEEATVVSPERDKFTAKFQKTRPGMTGWEATASALEEAGFGGEVAERLMRQLSEADTKKAFDRATKAIDTVLTGGLEALSALDDATANRWSKRWRGLGNEARGLSTAALDRALMMPDVRPQVSAMPSVQRVADQYDVQRGRSITVNNYFQPKGILDRESVRQIHKEHIIPLTKTALATDDAGLASLVRKKALE